MQHSDTNRPWYREFWPWFLMLFPAAAVVGGIITWRVAADSNDGVVEDDYYKQGLAINRVLARDRAAAARGLAGELRFEGERVMLRLTGRPESWPQAMTLRVLHPTRAGMDQTIVLTARDAGEYEGRCQALPPGKWKLLLEDDARTWRLGGELHPGQRAGRLAPVE